MSDNVNHPKHYENGPFECIELSRLLSFDWGNVVKYCYRWQSKNGVEDLREALWYANDAVIHGIPLYASYGLFDQRYVIFCHSLFGALADTDLAGLKDLLAGIREQLFEQRPSNGHQEQDQRNRKGR